MKNLKWLVIIITVLVLLGVLLPLNAQKTVSPETHKRLLTGFFRAEAARDYVGMARYFQEDFVRHSVASSAVMPDFNITSFEQYVAFLQATVAEFPDYYNTIEMLVAEGDYVAFRTKFFGTYAENGNTIQIPITGMVRFEGYTIAEMWVEWDNLTWNTQMMAEPTEVTERPVTNMDDLVGTWRLYYDAGAVFMEVSANGKSIIGQSPSCATTSGCIEVNDIMLEGNQMVVTHSSFYPDCDATYNVFVVTQENHPTGLRFEVVGSDCYTERAQAFSHIAYQVTQ